MELKEITNSNERFQDVADSESERDRVQKEERNYKQRILKRKHVRQDVERIGQELKDFLEKYEEGDAEHTNIANLITNLYSIGSVEMILRLKTFDWSNVNDPTPIDEIISEVLEDDYSDHYLLEAYKRGRWTVEDVITFAKHITKLKQAVEFINLRINENDEKARRVIRRKILSLVEEETFRTEIKSIFMDEEGNEVSRHDDEGYAGIRLSESEKIAVAKAQEIALDKATLDVDSDGYIIW